ncbi:metal ABC transporter ATP-binding protein [Paenibacillus mucilaginosus]|uniref:ABC transporter n=3 Tax=Paenibacillus mucilaginosus TaxID=61624 RepID=H6NL45_9BACL|nr:ABC transporter ATP-binding protein [Paenibacillus mucilaginosus]AEI41197.1 ABC transporter related protein [Paenibacillus mucilaginosus KNP414]AFC29752.1 ABC transporter [Paenibacillus mucilaginosus 3016]AFH61938.1 ABC transporter [Paenibacillus mucilaginosus K02]MCG7211377.1 ABC transporter ATP-binding protein [Paenibacillus mucilaginosus]WDM30240.1 ABC transporter ATP-binding protein [Paenibacillus mucilaginosus]
MQQTAHSGCHREIVSIDDVFFSYEHKTVIDGLNFKVLERDFVGLIGSNGAGKTTLLRMIVGLLKPTRGEIRLFGEPLSTFRDWERIGYVPQKNSLNPLFPATVREVVTSGLYGKKNMFRRLSKAQLSKADDALYAMRIEDLADRRIGQLSGGQQQRVFLARALINNPELLILDEPTVGIDAETQAGFFRMIRHMHQHHHITFMMVSHDMDMVQSYLGEEAIQRSGSLSFYVKHTHTPEDCRETDLTHSMQQLRESMEVLT